MRITKEFLEKHDACQEGIDFMVRNNIVGYDLDKIDEIEGDGEIRNESLPGMRKAK